MKNPLTAMLRRARQIRGERQTSADADLSIEDLLAGFRPAQRQPNREEFSDDRDWRPEDEDGPLWG